MKVPDFSGVISAAAVVAAIPAVAETTAVVGFFSAIISAGLTLVALIFRVADIIRRVKAGKLSTDKAAEEVEKLKGAEEMTEKRYILETPADLTAARSAMQEGGLTKSYEIEIAIDSLVGKFLAPVPKIFTGKFEWMKQCAARAEAALSFLPELEFQLFYTTDTEISGGTPGTRKVTTYDAPNGVPSTAQALGMTVEEKEADSPRVSKTRLAAATLSNAAIDIYNKVVAEIRKAFKPMILPIWDGGEE